MARTTTTMLAVALALILVGCTAVPTLLAAVPSPGEVGRALGSEMGLATVYDVADLKVNSRAESDANRAHTDASVARVRTDIADAHVAATAAYSEALALGKTEREALEARWQKKAATLEARDEAAGVAAVGAKNAADKNREEIDNSPRPQGPLTGIPGWGGLLVDLLLGYLGIKTLGKGGGVLLAKRKAAKGTA